MIMMTTEPMLVVKDQERSSLGALVKVGVKTQVVLMETVRIAMTVVMTVNLKSAQTLTSKIVSLKT